MDAWMTKDTTQYYLLYRVLIGDQLEFNKNLGIKWLRVVEIVEKGDRCVSHLSYNLI